MDSHLSRLIEASARRVVITRETVEIVEWDRKSPVNATPASTVIASLHGEDFGPCPDARVLLLRVPAFDIVLWVQPTHPIYNTPLQSDEEVAWTRAYLADKVLGDLLADPAKRIQAVAGALTVRIMRGVEAEQAQPR